MDCSAEGKYEGLAGVGTEQSSERCNNPISWQWEDVQAFLECNEEWSWIASPFQGKSGLEILSLKPGQVQELCIEFGAEKLNNFVGFVNYLRTLHWAFAIRNEEKIINCKDEAKVADT